MVAKSIHRTCPKEVFFREYAEAARPPRTTLWSHIRSARLLVILSVPLIYALVVPFAFLDLSVAIYQTVCFPIYGIPKVRRKDYLIFDRGRLAYLNAIEKVGCVFCSYANGLLAYIAEIAARTEQHFCPIKHAHPATGRHSQYTSSCPTEMRPTALSLVQSEGLAAIMAIVCRAGFEVHSSAFHGESGRAARRFPFFAEALRQDGDVIHNLRYTRRGPCRPLGFFLLKPGMDITAQIDCAVRS